MNYQAVEETIKAGYREAAADYRRDDEIEVTTPNHQRIRATLERLCAAFPHPLRVLDVGCGTGRHFHCLNNVQELVGLDITDEMLRAARRPVRREAISAKRIRLLRANVYLAEFPPESFDLIYSLGMFGNGCPVTTAICDQFYRWLAPGGRLYFNTVDLAGLPFWYKTRRRLRQMIYPFLPAPWRRALDVRAARQPFYVLTRRALRDIVQASHFSEFHIESHRCHSPLWSGRHLECLAAK